MQQRFCWHSDMRSLWRRLFLLAFAVVYACEPMLERVHEKFHIRREIFLAGMFCFGGGACGRGDLRVLFVGDAPCGEAWGRGAALVLERADGVMKGCCDFLEEHMGVPAEEIERRFLEKWEMPGRTAKEGSVSEGRWASRWNGAVRWRQCWDLSEYG